MRIVVAPDKFAGTLSAVEAADAVAEGWKRVAPDDATPRSVSLTSAPPNPCA